jgi:hypothetical protein
MDRLMAVTAYQVERMKAMFDGRFLLLDDDPQCVNVCFWYVPRRLRGKAFDADTENELGKVSNSAHAYRLLSCMPDQQCARAYYVLKVLWAEGRCR